MFHPTVGSRSKFYTSFRMQFSYGVATKSLLRDQEVLSSNLEKRVKRAIIFDPTVGSRSNFYTTFQMHFSLGYLWNRYSVTRRYGRPILSKGSRGPFCLIPPLDGAQIFTRVSGCSFLRGSYGIASS